MKKILSIICFCLICSNANAFESKYKSMVEEPGDVIWAECENRIEKNERTGSICLCTYYVFQAKKGGFMNTLYFLEESSEQDFYNVLDASIKKCEIETRDMKSGVSL